ADAQALADGFGAAEELVHHGLADDAQRAAGARLAGREGAAALDLVAAHREEVRRAAADLRAPVAVAVDDERLPAGGGRDPRKAADLARHRRRVLARERPRRRRRRA